MTFGTPWCILVCIEGFLHIMEKKITNKYLQENRNHIFVFGDNTDKRGKAGAAALRTEPNTYGFITKKHPNNFDSSFYHPDEYIHVFNQQLSLLIVEIENNPDKTYLISKLGAGLANRYNIWENIIRKGLGHLRHYKNVEFLYEENDED